jgi:ATP-dependent Lon protease
MADHDWKGGSGGPEDDDVEKGAGPHDVEAAAEDFSPELVAAPRLISVFPLQNTVLFPHLPLPLHIFEERYKAMIADALEEDRAVAIALTDEDEPELGAREVCSAGAITRVEHLEDGEKNIIVTGCFRARIVEVVERRPYPIARILPIDERGADLVPERTFRELRDAAIEWVFLQDSDNAHELIRRISWLRRPGHLADFLASHLFEDAALRQEILEAADVPRRVHRVASLVQEALERKKAEETPE